MNFGAQPSSVSPNSWAFALFFSPAEAWWARTIIESMLSSEGSVSKLNMRKMLSKMPSSSHLRNFGYTVSQGPTLRKIPPYAAASCQPDHAVKHFRPLAEPRTSLRTKNCEAIQLHHSIAFGIITAAKGFWRTLLKNRGILPYPACSFRIASLCPQ